MADNLPARKKPKMLFLHERRKMTMEENMASENIRPWMKRLAVWCAEQVKMPSRAAMLKEARRLTNFPILPRHIRRVIDNPAWRAYLDQVAEDIPTRAAEEAKDRSLEAIQAHFEAIQKLREEGNHKDLSKFTNPILERVWAKVEEGGNAPMIQINFGGREPIQEAEIISIEEVPQSE